MIVLSNAPWASPLMSHYYYFYYQNSKLSFILDGAVSAIEPAVLKESYASLYTLVLEAAKHDADSSSIRWVKIIAGLLLVYLVKIVFFFFPLFYGGRDAQFSSQWSSWWNARKQRDWEEEWGGGSFPFFHSLLPSPNQHDKRVSKLSLEVLTPQFSLIEGVMAYVFFELLCTHVESDVCYSYYKLCLYRK